MGRIISNNSSTVAVSGTVNTITTQGGRSPATPTISSGNVTSVASHTLTGSGFFSYGGDTHSGTQWQVATSQSFTEESIIADISTRSYLSSVNIGASALAAVSEVPKEEGTYYARVRYVSSGYESSAFSLPVSFDVSATIAANITSLTSNSYIVQPSYSGAGAPSSYTYRISTTEDMSNVIKNGSFTSTLTINNSETPDIFDNGTYYIELTTVGSNTVLATKVLPLSLDVASLFTGNSVANYAGNFVEFSETVTANGFSGTIEYQFSTTNTFDTVTFTTSSTTDFSAANLPGLDDRSNSYFCRAIITINNTVIPVSTARSVGAVFFYTSSTSTQTPAGYIGSIYIEAIGGGGAGAGAYSSASGGSSGNFETSTQSITTQSALVIGIGAGGPANGWSNPSSTFAGTTTVSIAGSTIISAAGGRNATMNQQTRVYGSNASTSAYGGEPGNPDGVAGQDHPITGISGGSGGLHNSRAGYGGNGYGAGGGGQTRRPDAGGSGGGGGGGGGAFTNQRRGGNGNYTNVGSGGAGAAGAVRITYQDW